MPAACSVGEQGRAACVCLFISTALACGGSAATPTTPDAQATPSPAGWSLVFSDEFETPGAPDPAKWGYELGYIRNNEKQYYTSRSENVRAEGGNLVIEGRREAHQGFGYTSASINTRGRFELLYGRVEVRAKLPSGTGTWPAIWMLGTNIAQVGWPTCGEIDIMENVGFDPLRIVGSVHTAAYNHTIGTQKSSSLTIANPADDFHVYAMEWYPDRIDVFVDGQKYFTFRNEGTGSRTWPFDRPQYLLINLAIGGAWGGQRGIDDARFPHRYLVDYVRIYQQR
jgi:beta-glucanase (GH16 family)